MISYHLTTPTPAEPWLYAKRFKTAELDDYQRISRCINGFVWSGIVWKDGVRRQDAFQFTDWCVLDFDSGEMTLDSAKNIFCDMTHVIGTTKSHQTLKGGHACDRFRVVLKFTERVTSARDYAFTMKKLLDRYPADPQATDAGRYFFPCKEIVSVNDDGYTEDARPAPENWGKPNFERLAFYKRCGMMTPFARWALTNPVPIGKRNTTWFRAAKDLLRIGLEPGDIYAKIAGSPTFKGRNDSNLLAEVESCIRSAAKSVAVEDVENGRAEG